MNYAHFMEQWDSVAFAGYNAAAAARYALERPKYAAVLKKNRALRGRHSGERCFVVLNGPSLNEHDLTPLRDEKVFCVNYMFRAPLVETIKPDYYCWCDAKITAQPNGGSVLAELREKCPQAALLFTTRFCGVAADDGKSYFTYSKHMPTKNRVRSDLAGLSSNFQTVAGYAVNCALYMGFAEIYILGLDFAPGPFAHFADLGSGSACADPARAADKDEVCGNYLGYVKAQYENYYLRSAAQRAGQRIINLNPDSCVRAYEFGSFERLFSQENGGAAQ